MANSELTFSDLLMLLCEGRDLAPPQMCAMMSGILRGEWTPAQIAAALVALKIKGETPSEIAAAAGVMREMATKINISDARAVDTCGTGGDGARTFNISTTAAFVAAAAGVTVAKHGNRAMSGCSGSSDVLEALGMPLTMSPDKVASTIETVGIGFLFAPNHHAAVRHAVPVRRELGVRTVFNLLGPLSNPAGVRRQVIGVYSESLLIPYAEVLSQLGAQHALVVHGRGEDGASLDEISISGETDIAELKDGGITRLTIAPEDFGLATVPLSSLTIATAEQAKERLLAVLDGESGAARDVVLLNAAAALIVGGAAKSFPDGIEKAATAIDSGAAKQKLDAFITHANQ